MAIDFSPKGGPADAAATYDYAQLRSQMQLDSQKDDEMRAASGFGLV